ncbi:MAG: RNA polymerase sigma factor [Pseudohongiella sp.]|nr:MAG: RNA polymerase sigma factor [Pseudohongiella sp.]
MGDHAITLINEPQSGEVRQAATYDELFDAHHRKVFLAAYRVTGNVQDAEDVLQAVFLRLLKRSEQPDYRDSSSAYLCRAAINGSLDILRSRSRVQTESLDEQVFPSTLGAAESETLQAEQRRHLRQAMQSLDQRAAEVFALRVFEDFSNAEIATVLEITSNNVAVIYHKARAQLQEILGELEGDTP